jgi:biopolymer transport protein ExbD
MKTVALGAKTKKKGVELNMSPLIDMVFILLIFFLVTTSFVDEAGVEMKQPEASNTPQTQDEKMNMYVEVTEEGWIYIGNQLVDIRSIRSRMERFYHENPLGNVVIMSNPNSRWGISVEVLDKVKEAGIENVVVVEATT